MSDVMAIGDGENDVALLAAAGVRCAMGNGSEALKERCVLSLRWCRRARACMRASWTCLAHLLTPCALSAPTTCWAPTMRREDGRSPLRWPCTPSRGWRVFRRARASARSSCKWQSTRAKRAGSCLRPLRARVPGVPPGRRRTGAPPPRACVSSPPARHCAAPTATGVWIARRRPRRDSGGGPLRRTYQIAFWRIFDITNKIERRNVLACHDVCPGTCVAHYQ